MKNYYLIDYENVGNSGFLGCEKLDNQSEIHIFYTNNSRKIDLDIFYNHGNADIIVHKVPAGKQSLDLHISSFVGYLTGLNFKKEFNCIIISKDTDYDNIINFWKHEKNIKILRHENIALKETAPATHDNNLMINIQKALEDVQIKNEDIRNVISICEQYIGNEKNKKQNIYRTMTSKYGQEKGLKIYRSIKSLI